MLKNAYYINKVEAGCDEAGQAVWQAASLLQP